MPRATSGTECDRSRFPLLRFLLRLSPTRHGKRKEREAGRSVRPAGILTHVGSVLRQRAEEASPVLRVSSFSTTLSSTLARDSLPLSARTRISPRESSSTLPLSLSFTRSLALSLATLRRSPRFSSPTPPPRRYTSCSSALFCLLFMSLPVPLPLSATLPPPPPWRRRHLLLHLLLAFPTCKVDLVASPPPRRPGFAVHQ